MSNPIKLEQKMRDHFRNKEGTAIFSQFYDTCEKEGQTGTSQTKSADATRITTLV